MKEALNINPISVGIEETTKDVVEALAKYVYEEAVEIAPYDTGYLANSISYAVDGGEHQGLNGLGVAGKEYDGKLADTSDSVSEVRGIHKASVYANAPYSAAVEYGHRIVNRSSTGQLVDSGEQPANPFLTKAYENVLGVDAASRVKAEFASRFKENIHVGI